MQNSILSLESILTISLDKIQQLLKILQQETELLKNNNIAELENLTLKKTNLTQQIEINEKQRVNFLSAKSLNPNQPEQWLNTPHLITIWDSIKNFAEQSKKQNQINGLVINGNRNRIKTQIEILSRSSLPPTDLVYSASGQGVKQRNPNTLARA